MVRKQVARFQPSIIDKFWEKDKKSSRVLKLSDFLIPQKIFFLKKKKILFDCGRLVGHHIVPKSLKFLEFSTTPASCTSLPSH